MAVSDSEWFRDIYVLGDKYVLTRTHVSLFIMIGLIARRSPATAAPRATRRPSRRPSRRARPPRRPRGRTRRTCRKIAPVVGRRRSVGVGRSASVGRRLHRSVGQKRRPEAVAPPPCRRARAAVSEERAGRARRGGRATNEERRARARNLAEDERPTKNRRRRECRGEHHQHRGVGRWTIDQSIEPKTHSFRFSGSESTEYASEMRLNVSGSPPLSG